ncbi:MAG TPA: hypothetical protein VGV87_08495 [Blastocatellia bacterium]|nr:hypothetical protein [Blastocatellia bacterium]
MKTCPACGLHVEDEYLYCWEDGTRLSGGETLALPPQRPTAPMAIDEHATPFQHAAEGVEEQPVLSCPACGGEFPLTFSACPVHDLPLTSRRISRQRSPARAATATVEEPLAQQVIVSEDEAANMFSDEPMLPSEPSEDSEFDFADDTPSREDQPEEDSRATGSWLAIRWMELRDGARGLWRRIAAGRQAARDRGRSLGLGFGFAASVESQQPSPPPGMRLAARATALALGLFGVGALYVFYRQVTRTPSHSTRAAAVQSGPAIESPLIATPSEAREYKDEPAPAAQGPADEEARVQAPQKESPPFRISNDASAPRTNVPPPARSMPAIQPSETSDPVPVPTTGRFNAQLVRVRSYKAPSGYSYTLTFTLYEHAGRPMKWERLSIVTHSASGATHTEMLPFQHWLAGSGALTFTLNVDMVGASEADWRGRISCMSVGADETGRPLRASFGTDVAP